MKLKLSALGLVLFLITLPAAAARKDKPTGDEIAAKAKAGKLQNENTTVGENCKLTPADLTHLGSMTDLEDGQFIGVLETDIASDKTGLAAGKYDLFLAKVGNAWHVYAESGGKIAGEAYSVLERKDTPKNMRPKFSKGSFCWWVWLIFTGFQVCI